MRSLIRQVLWLKCGDDRFVFLHAGDQSISHSTPHYSSTMPHIMRCASTSFIWLHVVHCTAPNVAVAATYSAMSGIACLLAHILRNYIKAYLIVCVVKRCSMVQCLQSCHQCHKMLNHLLFYQLKSRCAFVSSMFMLNHLHIACQQS